MTNDLGTLVIVILKAKNLPDKHSFYKQDVFAQIQIQDVARKSSVEIKGGQHPVWDEEVRVPIVTKATDETRTLQVSCWSQEPRGAELIGNGKVDISETLRTGEFDGASTLYSMYVHIQIGIIRLDTSGYEGRV